MAGRNAVSRGCRWLVCAPPCRAAPQRAAAATPPARLLAPTSPSCARHHSRPQVALWEAENAVQARYSLHQLQYLNAIIDTSAAKATHAQSAVIKRQFEKKLKAAKVRRLVRQFCLVCVLPFTSCLR